jgi:hypothetical protein
MAYYDPYLKSDKHSQLIADLKPNECADKRAKHHADVKSSREVA